MYPHMYRECSELLFLNTFMYMFVNPFLTRFCSTGIKEDKHFRILKYVLKL